MHPSAPFGSQSENSDFVRDPQLKDHTKYQHSTVLRGICTNKVQDLWRFVRVVGLHGPEVVQLETPKEIVAIRRMAGKKKPCGNLW